jgi:hypothetical protein
LTKSRPDIATAVSFASTHAAKPTVGAFYDMLYILNYLRDTAEQGLILHRGEPGRALVLTCYVDASYLSHSDSKSHTGYSLSFGSIGSFYSKSSKQTLVATSSTHAEIRALKSATVDIIFVINLCTELHRPLTLPCIIFEDNQPAIDISHEIAQRAKRCKHFLMLIAFIREQIGLGLIALHKVHTAANVADILTKLVDGSAFMYKAYHLLGIQSDRL